MSNLEQKFPFHCILLSVLAKPERVFGGCQLTLIWGFSAFSVLALDISSNSHNHSYILLINAKLLRLIILPEFKSSVLAIFSTT